MEKRKVGARLGRARDKSEKDEALLFGHARGVPLRVLILCVVSLLYTWKAQATELPSATKAQLHQIIGKLENAGAQVGLEIDDLGTVKNPQQFPAQNAGAGKVLFSYRATQSYMSASNWKLFTAFYALHSNVPDNARDTLIESDANIDKRGMLDLNLYLVGHGDPSLNVQQLHEAALALKAEGLHEVAGGILGSGAAFGTETFGGRYPFGWTLDDALWYYAPPINALAINRNQIDIYITGGKKMGDAAEVTYSPELPGVQIQANVSTGADDLAELSADDLLHWDRFEENKAILSVSGQVAPAQKLTEGVALGDPDSIAAKVLLDELQKAGIKVRGLAWGNSSRQFSTNRKLSLLYRIPAPPLKVLLTRMLKRSDNFYAEMILRSSNLQLTTVPKIRPELFALLKKNGINTSGLRMEDGSGLSRYTLITPRAVTQLLNAVQKMPRDKGEIFWNALPIAAVDGTLGKRMKSTFAQNNVRAKTGTFSTACNLSGYVTTRDGHRLAVSFLTNFGPETDICRTAQDRVFEILAAVGSEF
jgi:PBP4 family serine-type D-alanyl-D-alanine carboxypeptidase